MARKYYTLVSFQDERWSIEFGDYSRNVVAEEKAGMLDDYGSVWKSSELKIIVSGDTQAEINEAVAKLNATLESAD